MSIPLCHGACQVGLTQLDQVVLATSQSKGQKRSHETDSLIKGIPTGQLQKRPKKSSDTDVKGREASVAEVCNSKAPISYIEYWSEYKQWPREYFESVTMDRLLAQKKSATSLGRKKSNLGSAAWASLDDSKPKEEKSAPYRDPRFQPLLEDKGSFMRRCEEGLGDSSKKLCKDLLEKEQAFPRDTIFDDECFEDACEMLQNRNEPKVVQDISRLIVPSAESLAIRGGKRNAKHLKSLIESVNEGWNHCIPLIGSRPQPDYAVGFRRTAFTGAQLAKIGPIVGNIVTDISYFMATYYMYFPFLTCEAKCEDAAFVVADRQNAHSMTLAVRAVVELFRLVKREKEINREIMAFSISHNHQTVGLYGHYPVVDGTDTKYYRHSIHKFDLTALEGKEKWTAYRFTKNIYDNWMPNHLARIKSIIDNLPSGLSSDDLTFPEMTGSSQDMESSHLPQLTEPGSSADGPSSHQPGTTKQNVTLTAPSTASGTLKKNPRKKNRKRKS